MAKKVLINFTPTGMVPTKEMTQFVPITPDEIIKDTLEAAELGATMIHLHARDKHGVPTYKKEIYERIIVGIREKRPDLILIASCSGRDFPEFEKRSEVLELEGDGKPDMASLTLSSLNFVQQASVNSPEMVQSLAQKMKDYGIKPELEAFDLGMMNYAHYLEKKGIIEGPFYYNLLLGNIAGSQAKLDHVAAMMNHCLDNSVVCLAGLGAEQLRMNTLGLLWADGVRVGLEDNIHFDSERKMLARNSDLVGRIQGLTEKLGLELYTADEVRARLDLGREPMTVIYEGRDTSLGTGLQ